MRIAATRGPAIGLQRLSGQGGRNRRGATPGRDCAELCANHRVRYGFVLLLGPFVQAGIAANMLSKPDTLVLPTAQETTENSPM